MVKDDRVYVSFYRNFKTQEKRKIFVNWSYVCKILNNGKMLLKKENF